MTIASSNTEMKAPTRGNQKTKISPYRHENSKLKDMGPISLNDGLLQSSSAHRRYMRRGSRTPMMLQNEATAEMISQDPNLEETNVEASATRLQSCTSLRRYMRRGSRAPHMFQVHAAALVSHDPSFDDDVVSMCPSKRVNASLRQPRCSPIIALLALQLEGNNEPAHEASEFHRSQVENRPAESL